MIGISGAMEGMEVLETTGIHRLEGQHGVNVDDQQYNPGPLLGFYKRMLNLRRQTPALKECALFIFKPYTRRRKSTS